MKSTTPPLPKSNAWLADPNCVHLSTPTLNHPDLLTLPADVPSTSSLVGHIRTNRSTRTTPAAVSSSSSAPSSTSTTNTDHTPQLSLPSSSSSIASTSATVAAVLTTPAHSPDTSTSINLPHPQQR
nr:unnamed protein product [Spirometra erinaceieuropaei]